MTPGVWRLSLGQRAALASMFALIVAFNFWTATTSELPARPAKDMRGYYDLLANAFLSGHLYLSVQPRPELLQLADPYDSQQNGPYRLHDAALYNGRYYLYYGPAPALVLFAPFRLITGLDLPEPIAVAIFCSLGLLFSFLLLQLLCRTYFREVPFWLLLAGMVILAFGTTTPFLLRRALHYEVAISAGYTFALASIYLYVLGFLPCRSNRTVFVAASVLLGLAGGSRVPALLAGMIPLAIAVRLLRNKRYGYLRDRAITVVAILGPVGVSIILLGLYNYVRFGSWTEFGMHYTLQGGLGPPVSPRVYKWFVLSRLPPGLFYYLLAPPHFTADFPFVHAEPWLSMSPPAGFPIEPVAGIMFLAPTTLALAFAPFSYGSFRRLKVRLYLVASILGGIGLGLLILYASCGATMRYVVDFAPFLLIPALLVWYGWICKLRTHPWLRRGVVFTFVLTMISTVGLNAAVSLTGYYGNLKTGSPQLYQTIHDFFRPLESALRRIEMGNPGNPELIQPIPGSTIANGSKVLFKWKAMPGATDYWIDVGTAPAHGNIYGSYTHGATSAQVLLPSNISGSLYVQLYSIARGVTPPSASGNKYELTVTTANIVTTANLANLAEMSSPAPDSTLSGSTVTFSWIAGCGASAYWLDVGTVQGQGNVFARQLGTSVTNQTVTGIPTNGSTIYVQLFTQLGGAWQRNAYKYTAFH